MDVKKAIEQRRSIRKYKQDDVSDDLVRKVIEAARLAPSGNNCQPWRFLIARDELKEKLKQDGIIMQSWVYDAPVLIVCCADPRVYQKKHVDGWDDANVLRAVRDLSIAAEHMVLRAEELGLGTCYIGWIKKDEIKNTLDFPDHYQVPYLITVGYADEKPKPRLRKTYDEIVLNPK